MVKITNLPDAAALYGDEKLPIVQGGETRLTSVSGLLSPVTERSVKGKRIFGSVQFPDFNGYEVNPEKAGEILLEGARTALLGSAGSYLFANATSMGCIVDLALEEYDCLNCQPMLFGTNGIASNSLTRTVNLRYYPDRYSNAAKQRTFEAYVRGEAAATGWIVPSAVIPRAARGPFFPLFFHDGASAQLDVLDIGTGTWYAGAPVAAPAGWAGLTIAPSYDFVIGGAGSYGNSGYVFPRDNSAALNTAYQLKGAISDVFIVDKVLTHADAEAIVDGADFLTQIGGAANARLYCPLVDGAGNLSDVVTSNQAGAITFTPNGSILPGPTLKRQGTATYLTIDRINMPGHVARPRGAKSSPFRISGNVGDQAGDLMFRIIHRDTGLPIVDTLRLSASVPAAGRFEATASVPITGPTDKWQFQCWFSDAPDIVASTHSRMQAGPQVQILSQSEIVKALGIDTISTNGTGACMVQPEADLSSIWFAFGFGISGATTDDYWGARCPALGNKLCGAGETVVANLLRRDFNEPVMIVEQTISGSSFAALMDDSDPSRTWDDYLTRQSYGAVNSGANGEAIITGEVIGGWEAFYSGAVGIMQDVYQPWITGRGWPNATLVNRDHWAGDGHMSFDPVRVVMPCNRVIGPTAGLTDTDATAEADQRDDMRNWAHLLGYLIGPETTTHKMENESGGAFGASGASVTHPLAGDWQGSIEMAAVLAECVKMALGCGSYPGPVFFESLEPGSASNKVIVRLGQPRPYPGEGLVKAGGGFVGYSTAYQRATIGAASLGLHTKAAGGNARWGIEAKIDNAGAFSVNNVTDAQILADDPTAVELTLSANYVAGETQVRHCPGGGGAYANATVDQDTYRAGRLFVMGGHHQDGNPGAVGFAVAGSNVPLVLA